jgi:hypothetical protein
MNVKNTTIWKFPIPREMNEYGDVSVTMPWGAHVLSAGVQNNTICVWAEVKPDDIIKSETSRNFGIRATGGLLTGDETAFVGTVFQGHFVWHVYELKG